LSETRSGSGSAGTKAFVTSRTGNIDDKFEWVLRYDVAGDTWEPEALLRDARPR